MQKLEFNATKPKKKAIRDKKTGTGAPFEQIRLPGDVVSFGVPPLAGPNESGSKR